MSRPRGGLREGLWLGFALALPLPWLSAHLVGLAFVPEVAAVFAGIAILGAAFLLSWATELAERDLPQSLALLLLALVSVMPEYAVDLHFAIRAGQDPTYAQYAIANMTGANRLLIGLGWAAVVLVAAARGSREGIRVHPRQRLEIRYLLLATLYSFAIPLTRTLNLLDAVVLLALFVGYAAGAARSESAEVELVGPAAWIDSRTGTRGRRGWAAGLLLLSGYAIFVSAEPFADGLVFVGRNHAIDEFLLVQWLAPLASESPEFIIAILFAARYRADVGLGALVSAKVNQWTLLVGALPIAYAISSGTTHGLPLDGRQMEEVFLTSAQSLLAVVLIVELHFSLTEAVLLAALFVVQLIFPSPEVRLSFAVLYLALAAGLVVHSPERRAAFRALLVRSD